MKHKNPGELVTNNQFFTKNKNIASFLQLIYVLIRGQSWFFTHLPCNAIWPTFIACSLQCIHMLQKEKLLC